MDASGQPTAAWRRRQRRLRSMLRHERQTVAMELAAALHHSRSGRLGTRDGPRAQKAASAGPAEYFDLTSDDGWFAGGGSGRRHWWSRGRSRGTGGTRGRPSSSCSTPWCRSWAGTTRSTRPRWSSIGGSKSGATGLAGICRGRRPSTGW